MHLLTLLKQKSLHNSMHNISLFVEKIKTFIVLDIIRLFIVEKMNNWIYFIYHFCQKNLYIYIDYLYLIENFFIIMAFTCLWMLIYNIKIIIRTLIILIAFRIIKQIIIFNYIQIKNYIYIYYIYNFLIIYLYLCIIYYYLYNFYLCVLHIS